MVTTKKVFIPFYLRGRFTLLNWPKVWWSSLVPRCFL